MLKSAENGTWYIFQRSRWRPDQDQELIFITPMKSAWVKRMCELAEFVKGPTQSRVHI